MSHTSSYNTHNMYDMIPIYKIDSYFIKPGCKNTFFKHVKYTFTNK